MLPGVAETKLLRDAVQGLSDLFLLVVVGEFNSGKSTLINSLLGGPYLEQGVLPTTNEIAMIKYGTQVEEAPREEDGISVR